MSSRAFVGLGSNLEEPARQLVRALEALAGVPGVGCVCVSPFYRSRAVGPGVQPDYVNAVALLETSLAPLAFLSVLQAVEDDQGRVRGAVRWTARTLDLDVLLFDDLVMDTDRLVLPHPRMQERNFVLQPLFDIAPDLVLPDSRKVADLLKLCSGEGIELLG